MTDSLKCEAHGMNYVIHGRFARDVSVAQELQAVGFSLSEEVNCKNISSFLIPLQPVLKGQFPPQNQKCITCSAIYHGLFGWESRFDIGLPFLSNVMQLDDTRLVVPNKYIWETLFHQNYTHQWTSGLLSKGIKLTSITDLLRGFWVQNQRRSPIFL